MREETITLDLEGLEKFCEDLSLKIKVGDTVCLFGDLGSGKTTFARNLIKSIYKRNKLEKPTSIKSPSFPILLTYEELTFYIYKYAFLVSGISSITLKNILLTNFLLF